MDVFSSPSRKKYESKGFVKQMSSAVRVQRARFQSITGEPLNPHISGSSNLDIISMKLSFRSHSLQIKVKFYKILENNITDIITRQ
jgi:hypothetical protein